MRIAVYVLRDDPDYPIFDIELSDPPVGEPREYDCTAVFDVPETAIVNNRCLRIGDREINGQQILLEEYQGLPIKCLWHAARSTGPSFSPRVWG